MADFSAWRDVQRKRKHKSRTDTITAEIRENISKQSSLREIFSIQNIFAVLFSEWLSFRSLSRLEVAADTKIQNVLRTRLGTVKFENFGKVDAKNSSGTAINSKGYMKMLGWISKRRIRPGIVLLPYGANLPTTLDVSMCREFR